MKHPIRLYDLSLGSAVMIIAANFVLLCAAAGTAAFSDNPLPALVVLVILVAACVAQAWYFLWKSPVLEESCIRQGKRSIDKASLSCEIFYNARYREKTVRFFDKRTPEAKHQKSCMTVQATKANQKKLSEWLGHDVPEASNDSEKAPK